MNIFEMVLILVTILYLLNDCLLLLALNSIKTPSEDLKTFEGISVIIAAKNEYKNLKNNLIFILAQNYKDFEVIVVDDQSEDDTVNLINDLKFTYSNLEYIKVPIGIKSSKKNALTLGIKKAKHNRLAFTDADCKPLSNKWLSTLNTYFQNEDSMVLGYSPYNTSNSNLNKIIRYETYQTALNYFGYAQLGNAYMGVGRNLGYTKTVFNKANGFNSHLHVLSGDDDLLVGQVSGQVDLKCCLEPDSFVESTPKNTFRSWISQKRRHYSSAPSYKLKHQLLQTYQFMVKFLFWFAVIPPSIIFLFNARPFTLLFILIGLMVKLAISKSLYQRLEVKDIWLISILLEFQLICLQLYIFSLNLYSSKQKW